MAKGLYTNLYHIFNEAMHSSEIGLAISSAMAFMMIFQCCVRESAELENLMISPERVIEYGNLPSEAPLESSIGQGKRLPPEWPSKGNIQFNQMSLRYSKDEETILKNISCFIRDKEKVGIVGRTGAGKSSLTASLFRLAEPEGQIIIDGVDIMTIGLHELRSKVSIIPQDPVLFAGSLRKNLDPFNEYDDRQLCDALEAAKFKESTGTESMRNGSLDFVMTEGGSNLSVGQRQLVCLARAVLRRNRILVIDEATANIDQQTDRLIQIAIREHFRDCTVLTIAHRLNTIIDSDRIMVLDAGYLKEFDEPAVLLDNPDSIFYGLVKEIESTEADSTNQ